MLGTLHVLGLAIVSKIASRRGIKRTTCTMTIDFIGCVLYRSLRKVKSIARLSEKVARKDIAKTLTRTFSKLHN